MVSPHHGSPFEKFELLKAVSHLHCEAPNAQVREATFIHGAILVGAWTQRAANILSPSEA